MNLRAGFAAAMFCAAVASPCSALAQAPEWAKLLEFVDKPALQIDKRSDGKLSGKAKVVIKNNGAERSKQITIECVVYDQAGNTVDQMSGFLGPVNPGKLGIVDVSAFSLSSTAADIECEIAPGSYLNRTW